MDKNHTLFRKPFTERSYIGEYSFSRSSPDKTDSMRRRVALQLALFLILDFIKGWRSEHKLHYDSVNRSVVVFCMDKIFDLSHGAVERTEAFHLQACNRCRPDARIVRRHRESHSYIGTNASVAAPTPANQACRIKIH